MSRDISNIYKGNVWTGLSTKRKGDNKKEFVYLNQMKANDSINYTFPKRQRVKIKHLVDYDEEGSTVNFSSGIFGFFEDGNYYQGLLAREEPGRQNPPVEGPVRYPLNQLERAQLDILYASIDKQHKEDQTRGIIPQ